ncbi:MAG TPA: methyl-accepting chemotaxis protein [Thermodesulfovibrionales bacterium]|nr:methyl-accepting chemotaxis protein [Thermodesulfovibrionales bacterium]
MQQRTWRRRNYFISKEFQGRFVLRFFLAILAGAVVFTLIFSIFSAHTITVTYEDSILKVDRTPKALAIEIVRTYGVYIVLLGLGISLVSLFLSHRIAGPLYRLERSVEELTKGNLSFNITLRRKDELKELAASLNEMIRVLSDQIRDIKIRAGVIEKEVLKMSGASNEKGGAAGETGESLSEAIRAVEDLKQSLSFFKLDKE